MEIKLEAAQRKLGAAIRAQRISLGYSQEALAEKCGVHRTYMGSIERGERNLSLLNLLRVAKALRLCASELMTLAKL